MEFLSFFLFLVQHPEAKTKPLQLLSNVMHVLCVHLGKMTSSVFRASSVSCPVVQLLHLQERQKIAVNLSNKQLGSFFLFQVPVNSLYFCKEFNLK